jgi:hypothetical protein
MAWSPSAALRFAAGAVVAVAAAYAVSEVVDPVHPEVRERVAIFRERMPRVEAVAVGNSHGGAIDFDALGVTGMHFSMAGQDAFEGAFLVRYAAGAPRLRYVLFGLSYGLQRGDHALVARGTDLRSRRRKLYARIPLQRPIEGDRTLWIQGVLSPIVRDDHWRGVVGRPFRATPPLRFAADGKGLGELSGPLGRDSLERYAATVAALHARLGAETIELAPDTPGRVTVMLDSLARELRAKDVALVFYTPPYHETYLRWRDPAVVTETRAMMARIVASNPNAVWLDYSTDPRFGARDELFNNSDHLNPTGARTFSLLLRDCLRARLPGSGDGGAPPACPAAAFPAGR